MGGASWVNGFIPWVVTMWCSPAVMTSVEGPGYTRDVVGSRLLCAISKLPSPSSFIWESRSWFLIQYPACWCWSRYHLSFMNSTKICCAVLGLSTMYPLSWFSHDEIQCPSPSTSAKRSFSVLLCTSTHSLVLGISRRRAARVVKLDLCHGSTGLWVRGLDFEGRSERNQGDQLLVNAQALNVGCALCFKGHKGNERWQEGPDQGARDKFVDC